MAGEIAASVLLTLSIKDVLFQIYNLFLIFVKKY